MSKYKYEGYGVIRDTEIDFPYHTDDIVELLYEKDQQIAELEEQLKNARKETAKKVIARVEELSVFDFEAYEEMDFRRYIVSQTALDNILKEYGGSDGC